MMVLLGRKDGNPPTYFVAALLTYPFEFHHCETFAKEHLRAALVRRATNNRPLAQFAESAGRPSRRPFGGNPAAPDHSIVATTGDQHDAEQEPGYSTRR